MSNMKGNEKSEDEDHIEVPECFGSFDMTDDCFGCPFETECQIEIIEEEGECD